MTTTNPLAGLSETERALVWDECSLCYDDEITPGRLADMRRVLEAKGKIGRGREEAQEGAGQ